MWISETITISAGSPVRLTPGRELARSLIITPLLASSGGVIYVLNQDPGTTLAKTANSFVTELAAATSSVPGGRFELYRHAGDPPIEMAEWGLDGAHTADTVQVSWEPA